MFEYLNYGNVEASQKELSQAFHSAGPFEHIVVKDLIHLDKLEEVMQSFPDKDWPFWKSYSGDHAKHSKVCEAVTKLPLEVCHLLYELNSGPFLKILQNITGIENLLPDPHFRGAGMHMTLPGGTLTPHIDHHVYPEHPRYRQVNLIIYLTKDWSPQNQGYFELWDSSCKEIKKEVTPTFGNCLIFRTSDSSMHGFSKPVKVLNRCSISVFYYTATPDPHHYGGNSATFWQPQTIKAEGWGDSLRLRLQNTMWSFARTFGKLSWHCQRRAMNLEREPR